MAKGKVRQSRASKSELVRLRARLAEAEDTLNAIRKGEVDAIAVDGPHGRQIFTLQSAEQPYRLLAERMNEGAATLTTEGTILFCNPRLAEMVGVSPERLLGSSLSSLLRDETQENFPELVRQALKKDVRAEGRLLRNDGTTLPVQLSLSSIPLEESEQGICLVASDLSGQKQVEDAARQSENLNRTLLESLPQMIFAKDRNSRYLRCNENFAKLLGIRSEDFPGKTDYDFFNPALAEKYRADDQRVMQSGVTEEIEEEYQRDGQTMTVQTVKAPFRNADGDTIGVLGVFFDVTARKQAEKQLREQAALLDLAHDAILFRSLDSRILLWNRGAKDLYGWSAEEALGKVAHELLQTRFPDSLEAIQTSIEETREWEGELKHISRDGKAIVVASRWSLLRDEKGNPTAILEINRDITERKRVEEELRTASLYTRSLIEASLDPLVTISREGKITDVNEATEKVTGVSRERLIGSDFSNYFTDPESARRGYEQVFAQGAVQDYPLAIRSTAGKVTDVLYNATVFKNEAGEVEGAFAAARDVTERKRAEDALRESELRIRTLLDSTAEAILGAGLDLNCTFTNPAAIRLLGYQDPVELLGKNLHAAMHHKRADGRPLSAEDCPLARDVQGGRAFHADDLVLGRKDGTSFPAECWSHPLVKNGEVTGSVVTFFDITERKRAEQEIRTLNQELEQRVQQRTAQLHDSERRVRRKLESILSPEGDLGNLELGDILDVPAVQSLMDDFYELAHVPMFILDLKSNPLVSVGWQEICTKFHRVHPEACRNCQESDQELSTGVAPGEFKLYKCKNNLWDVVTPILVGGQHVGNLFSGQFFFTDEPVDYELFRSQARKYGFDEQEYLAALERVPRLSREAVDTGMAFLIKFAQVLSQLSYSGIKLARSVTEIGRVNAELAASVKELEAFTYSVSHDLRAPLRHISGFSKILTEEYGSSLPSDAQHHLQRIQEGTRRMGLLVDDLLNLARVGRRDLSLQVTGLKSIVDEVVAELAAECQGRQIEWKIGALPFVECDPGLIKQVLQNLLSNAIKFTRPRSPAVIEVGQKEEDGASVVYVRDNGVGFSMKYADKLFGVFQRLHRAEDFEGTGVGLATVQRIVQKHGGRIWAKSELDEGATFCFTLGNSERNEMKANTAVAGENA